MDNPDTTVTWTSNCEGLPGAKARTIRDAIAVAEHALALWHDMIRAATTNAISIVVTIGRGRAEIDTQIDPDKLLVHVDVPADLLSEDPHVLGTRLLDAVTDSLVTLSMIGLNGTLLNFPRYIDDMRRFQKDVYPLVQQTGLR